MIELNLNEDNNFASIMGGGPGTSTGICEHFPLETLLNSVSDYSIRGLEEANVRIDGMAPFQTPVLLLYNKKTDESAVCLAKRNPKGPVTYKIYNYSNPETLD